MTEKEIKSEITEKLKQGTSKSFLYDQFKDKIKDEALRRILASSPTYEQRLKFKIMHLILSIIWGLFILLELIGILDFIISFDIKLVFSMIISIYITINIWKFDGRFFIPGIVWFAITILYSFFEINSIYQDDPYYNLILIITSGYSLILVVGIYLMHHIKKNVFSYLKWFQPTLNRDDEIQFEK